MTAKTKPTKQERRGVAIREARALLGWTRAVMAESLGISLRSLAEMEQSGCTVRRLHMLAVECLLRRADLVASGDYLDRFVQLTEETEP
jgi:transcriptional regulator with XRE-family HTH domain